MAVKTIKIGDEITIDYGKLYFSKNQLQCNCGSEKSFEKQQKD
jgi:hypothetical protein